MYMLCFNRGKKIKHGSIHQNKYQKQPSSPSTPPLSSSSATPGLRMLHLFDQNRGVFDPPSTHMHGAITAQRRHPLLNPCGPSTNGTALLVSQLVAMVTHPTSLACIPPCFLRAGNGGKKELQNKIEDKQERWMKERQTIP